MNVLDLFSGIGGFSYGLELAGNFNTLAFCEIDKECHKVLNKHWPRVPVFEDIRLLKSNMIKEKINISNSNFIKN
jgi:DNA (cytosine-5)-methyltransferase 1